PGTVLLVVEFNAVVVTGADNEPGVGTQFALLQTRDHPAGVFPGVGLALESIGGADFFAQFVVSLAIQHRGYIYLLEQPAVRAEAHQIVHVVPVAPAQQSGTVKAAVTPEHDAGIRPVLPNELHQQGQNGPAVAAVASVAG